MDINFSFNRELPIMGIYCILNIINNKKYIGSSTNVLVRLEKHRSLLRGNRHDNSYLQNAWNKYGENNFICFLLEAYDKDISLYLTEREQYWIDFFNSDYNLTKIVERNVLSAESRIKQSDTRKRLFKEGKLIPTAYKPIKKYDLNGKFLEEYKSVNDAANSENIHVTTVIRNAQKKTAQGSGFIWRYSSDKSDVLPLPIGKKRVKWERVFKDLVKSDKLLETPEEDNQQPTTNLND